MKHHKYSFMETYYFLKEENMLQTNLFKIIIILTISIFITGCAQTYPKTLTQNPTIEKDTAIILVGVKGTKKVNYLQFCHASFPCNNFEFETITNDILALKIKVPKKNFELKVYALQNTFGHAMGYHSVDAKTINIDKKGIYFYGVLDTDLQIFDTEHRKQYIHQAKIKHGSKLLTLKPINFQWED